MLALIYPILTFVCISTEAAWGLLLIPFNILLVPIGDHLVRWLVPDWSPSHRLMRFLFHPAFFAAYAVSQLGVLAFCLVVSSSDVLGAFELWAIASAAGIMTGTAGITAAHELMHRRGALPQGAAQALLLMVSYAHFSAVHLRHHHKYVATSKDPGSATMGTSFPAYFSQALASGLAISLDSERRRLAGQPRPSRLLQSRVVRYLAIQIAIYLTIATILGANAVIVFAMQSFVAVHLLEAVNYVQHYGLTRESGKSAPHPVGPAHAWDSDFRLSELLVFNLSRHADHHMASSKRCDELVVRPESPKLPYSFFFMVFMALIPPLWRRVMDKRLQGAEVKDFSAATPGLYTRTPL